MTNLLVNEVFESIQGEGSYTGVPSIFVRLQGCPVGCPWCDTQHTWKTKPDKLRDQNIIMRQSGDTDEYFSASPDDLFALFKRENYRAKHIVVTGGEPCMFDLRALTAEAKRRGFSTQIETSGTFEVLCIDDTWVTLSPKINMKGGYELRDDALLRANEIKHPVAMKKHIHELDEVLDTLGNLRQQADIIASYPQVYLQPISMQARATELAVSTCIERNWRLSLQTHKFIGVE
ncbi:7-carboxy-7-deazaguanine synthase QueE [Ningiella sp. W23]|uniref:7-carboxy-7-deazaguanine synthase QueE n=1 Tax=Ningiella sp. W23 TaxID=3023715 RepID=UPI003757866B